jgi:putative membrane protein
VTIKQSKQLEDTYYRIIKLLNDDKVKKQIVFPVALLLLVGAIFVVLHMVSTGIGAILFTLGVYLLIRVFNMEKRIALMWSEIRSGFFAAKISFYTAIVALIVLAVSIFYSWNVTRGELGGDFVLFLLAFLKTIVWGMVGAGLIYALGKFIDAYVRERRVMWSYWIVPFSLLAFGFIGYAVFESLYLSISNDFSIDPFLTGTFVSFTATGVVIAFIGAITYHYIRDIFSGLNKETSLEGKRPFVPGNH